MPEAEEIRLRPEDQETLIKLQPEFDRLTREIAKAKRAGIDVTDLEATFLSAKKLREGVLREYGV